MQSQNHQLDQQGQLKLNRYNKQREMQKDLVDVLKILKMSDIDKIKHDYLTYRIQRLKDAFNNVQKFR